MSKKSKKEEIKEEKLADTIRDRIAVSIKFMKDWKASVDTANLYWTGKSRPKSISRENYYSVNYIYAIIKDSIARMYYRNPQINVEPVNGKDPAIFTNAKNAQLVLNWQAQKKEYRLRDHIKLALLDWQRTGMGVVFTGWTTLLEQEKDEIKRIQKDQPDIKRIHPKHIYLAPGFTRDKIDYVVLEYQVPLKEVKNNKNFNQKVLDGFNITSYLDKEWRDDGNGGTRVKETEDMARVTLYHYYDAEHWFVMLKGADDPLMEKENPYTAVFGEDNPLPITIIWGDDDLASPFPISKIDPIKDVVRELSMIRSQQVNHRKRFNRKALYDSNSIDETKIEKLKNPDDGTMIGIALESGKTLDGAIYPIPEQPLQYPFQIEPMVKEDIYVISGTTPTALTGKSANPTLGQDELSAKSAQNREEEDQSQVEQFVEAIYQRLLQLDQTYLQQPVAMQVSGSIDHQWMELTSTDIAGGMTLKVISGSMVRETDEVVRKQAMDVLNLVGMLPIGQPLIPEIIQKILDTFPMFSDIAEKIRRMMAQPQPPILPPQMGETGNGPMNQSILNQNAPTASGLSNGANKIT